MIKTYDLYIYMKGKCIEYNNISRVAVKRYFDFWKDNDDFYGYDLDDSKLDRNGEDLA